MKMISANKLNRLWKNGVVAKMVAKTKVLKTIEEISANTNVENVAGATAVKELSNNLNTQLPGSVRIVSEGSGASTKYYAQIGADTASKKLLGSRLTVVAFLFAGQNVTASFVADTDYEDMLVCAADARIGYAQIKINGVLANVTETMLREVGANHDGYIIINNKINAGDTVSIKPKGGDSNNHFWFLG